MHIIGACLGKQNPDTDTLLCGMCFNDDIDRAPVKKVPRGRLQDTDKEDWDFGEAEFEGPYCKVIRDAASAFCAPCPVVKKVPQHLLQATDKDSGERQKVLIVRCFQQLLLVLLLPRRCQRACCRNPTRKGMVVTRQNWKILIVR
jgi:hypothetical protein